MSSFPSRYTAHSLTEPGPKTRYAANSGRTTREIANRAGPGGEQSGRRRARHRPEARLVSPLPVGLAPVDRAGQEHQAELPDLDLVPVGQHRGVHRLAVDVRAVEAADIYDQEVTAFPP